jgi:hypothetical protein
MADRIGADYDHASTNAPDSDTQRVMVALLCSKELLYSFTYWDQWPSWGLGSVDKREARHAAKYLAQTLEQPTGRDAIAHGAAGIGTALAAFWQDTAKNVPHEVTAAELCERAASSEALSTLVSTAWPLAGYEPVLDAVRQAQGGRMFDVEKPDAMIDLKDYARHVRVTAESRAVAMSERFDHFETAITGPVRHLNVAAGALASGQWAHVGTLWGNLLRADPLPYLDAHRLSLASLAPKHQGHLRPLR